MPACDPIILRRRWWPRLALLAAVVVLATVSPATPAAAHATLIESSPGSDQLLQGSPPGEVSLLFDEGVETSADSIRVFGPSDDRVDDGEVTSEEEDRRIAVPIEDDGPGTYTVAWRVLSKDGHTITGSFVFHVDTRTGAADISAGTDDLTTTVDGVARWLTLAGTITVLGGLAIALTSGDAPVQRRLRLLLVVAGAVAFVGAVVLLLAQTATTSGRDLWSAVPRVVDVGLDSRSGVLTAIRAGCLLLVTLIAAMPTLWQRAAGAALTPALGAVVVTSLTGHPWTSSVPAAAVTSDALHLLAVGLWIGGLVSLLLALPVASDRARLARRFSTLALVMAGVVAVTGTVSALFQITSVDALINTTYGRLVIAKVVLFGALLALGWMNRSRLVGAVDRSAVKLVRNVRFEVAGAAVVLALTVALIDQPPAREAVAKPFDTIVTTDQGTLQAEVQPARTGENELHLYFFDPAGVAPAAVDAVEVTVASDDIPPRRLEVEPVTTSHVSSYGVDLPSAGTWVFRVTAVRQGTPATYTFEVPVR